jgi:hypothetical protein
MKHTAVKVGQRVIYARYDGHTNSERNPLWGGKHGNVIGTVTKIDDTSSWPIKITWDNGTENAYKATHLDPAPDVMTRAKMVANKVRKFVKPYEKYIGLIALAAAIDYFILNGKFSVRLMKLAESFVNRVADTIDRAIDKLNPAD